MLFALLLAAVAQPVKPALLEAALNPNPGLKSYIADAELVARAHPLPLKRTFRGTAYYVAPTRRIVFDGVSGVLSRFRSLTTTIPSYARVQRDYAITLSGDDGRASTFTLVPTKLGGRVTGLVVTIDDAKALVDRVVYHYGDGSFLSFDEHYLTVEHFHLAASIDVSAHFPGYSVDGTIRLADYHTNVAVPESSFKGS